MSHFVPCHSDITISAFLGNLELALSARPALFEPITDCFLSSPWLPLGLSLIIYYCRRKSTSLFPPLLHPELTQFSTALLLSCWLSFKAHISSLPISASRLLHTSKVGSCLLTQFSSYFSSAPNRPNCLLLPACQCNFALLLFLTEILLPILVIPHSPSQHFFSKKSFLITCLFMVRITVLT